MRKRSRLDLLHAPRSAGNYSTSSLPLTKLSHASPGYGASQLLDPLLRAPYVEVVITWRLPESTNERSTRQGTASVICSYPLAKTRARRVGHRQLEIVLAGKRAGHPPVLSHFCPRISKNRTIDSTPRWKFGMWNFSFGACRLSSGSPMPIMMLGIFRSFSN